MPILRRWLNMGATSPERRVRLMKPFITPPGADLTELLQAARRFGFDKFLYTVESERTETSHPLRVVGNGWSRNYLDRWLARIEQDPLRRMVARGELPITNLPIVFENDGHSLSLLRRPLSAGEASLLEWCLSEGVRTGVSMAVRMAHGHYATINFYATTIMPPAELRSVTEKLFLMGHEAHARLEGTLPFAAVGSDFPRLSTREQECLQWMAQGKQTTEIACILGIAGETVRDHTKRIFRKLAVNSRAQAVARGYTLGYLH